MNYPVKYKELLKALKNEKLLSLKKLCQLFDAVRNEIEENRGLGDVTQTDDPEGIRMEYSAARKLVSETVDHQGFLEINGEMHDSVDDCADLLMDLDEIEKLEAFQPAQDVWWAYVFKYDSHFGDHMKNIEVQARWLASYNQEAP